MRLSIVHGVHVRAGTSRLEDDSQDNDRATLLAKYPALTLQCVSMTAKPPRRLVLPNRRLAKIRPTPPETDRLGAQVRYVGSGHHKRYPADYGFARANPVPWSSLCDERRPIGLGEATALLVSGIARGMVSERSTDGIPRYIWAVSSRREVFEAQTHPNTPGLYHGYPLNDNDDMKAVVLNTWDRR